MFKLVLCLSSEIAKKWSVDEEQPVKGQQMNRQFYMSKEEADLIWRELDQYNYGDISAHIVQRWLDDAA